jgi:diguanylate cyclase (GGDEF)-like protein
MLLDVGQKTVKKTFNLLIIEDSEDDALLLIRALRKGGLTPNYLRVDSKTALTKALENSSWDMVITDHNMPGFSSEQAIQLVNEITPRTPLIMVSGTVADDVAVNAMRQGAQDYVLKHNLTRLIPAIERELRESKARHETEQALAHISFHDPLTNLLNRAEFERKINQAVKSVQSNNETHVLMYLDLDQFKIVNDTCGHMAGDELLKQVTSLLKLHVRSNDDLARLGGDEFGILVHRGIKETALRLAERIRSEIKEHPFHWQDKRFDISISIGMVSVDRESISGQELLSCADVACYAAKDKGRDGIQWYTPKDKEYNQRREEMRWASKIRNSLKNEQFFLHFQPMQALQTESEALHGEFLIRLMDEEQIIPPGVFIPAAERYNLMPAVDRWVIENVFKLLAETGLGFKDEGTFFINLSGLSLSDKSFFNDLRYHLKEYKINPNRICLEITETAAISNLGDAVGFIKEIRAEGFKFALDDFGAGLSSFSYLKTIPVDYLKIDGSFVQHLLNDPIDRGIVEACNQISHAAGLKTIAEFIENKETLEALKHIGVDFGQGYVIAKPAPLTQALKNGH